MEEKGPCNHCGIESTLKWRKGPQHKPILCNACGTKWRVATLENYIPRHGFADGHNIEVTPTGNPSNPVCDHEPKSIQVPKSINHSSKTERCSNELEGDTSGGSTIASSNKFGKCESELSNKDSGLTPPSVQHSPIPRRKRSERSQDDVIGALQRQLRAVLRQPEFEHLREEQEVLIPGTSQMSSNEIGLGCVLLKSPDLSKK